MKRRSDAKPKVATDAASIAKRLDQMGCREFARFVRGSAKRRTVE